MNKKILIDFSKVISPIGISRFVAKNVSPLLTIDEKEVRDIYKSHISELVTGIFSIKELIQEYLSFLIPGVTEEELYQKFHTIPPVDKEFLLFLEEKKKEGYQIYLVSDVYPELGEKFKQNFKNIFDKFIFSYELGVKKSNSLFWDKIKENDIILFIDDKENNIEEARKRGIDGFLFTTFDDFKKRCKIKNL